MTEIGISPGDNCEVRVLRVNTRQSVSQPNTIWMESGQEREGARRTPQHHPYWLPRRDTYRQHARQLNNPAFDTDQIQIPAFGSLPDRMHDVQAPSH